MGIGKHTEEAVTINNLKEQIKLKNRELEEVKMSCADVFKEIYYLNTCNTCNVPATRRKITELAKNTQYELMKDIAIENDVDINKIIELPNDRKSIV